MWESNFDIHQIIMFYKLKSRNWAYSAWVIFLVLGFLNCTNQACSQSYSKTDSVAYLTPSEYAMMLDRDDRFLLRIDLLAVGLEWSFTNKVSVVAEVGMEEWPYGSVELRRYFETKNITQTTLSGMYISLGAEAFNSNGLWLAPYSQYYYAKLGLQRRFLGNGLADFGVRAGYVNENIAEYDFIGDDFEFETINERYFLVETTTSIGLAFATKRKNNLDYDRLCPVLKCFDTERFLVKLNAANSFRLAVGQAFDIYLQPSLAIEQKLGNAPFSVQAKLKLRQAFSATDESSFYSTRYQNGFTVDVEGRYYYNLKNRMAKGKTGNSLSANYVSLVFSRRDQWTYTDGSNVPNVSNSNGIFIQTGVQRTFGERLYFDVYIGLGSAEWGRNRKSLDALGAVECGWRF
jgi:hypothetical protein